MAEPYVGEIKVFGFTFVPYGWLQCNGGTVAVSQFNALFSLINTTYGGDGKIYFQLPNLQNKLPMGSGQGPDLTDRIVGETPGADLVTLNSYNMPRHTHAVTVETAKSAVEGPAPANQFLAVANYVNVLPRGELLYSKTTPTTGNLSPAVLSPVGGVNNPAAPVTAHENRQPALSMNYCIATEGIWPTHP